MSSFSLTRQSNYQFVLAFFSGTAPAWCLSYLRTEEDLLLWPSTVTPINVIKTINVIKVKDKCNAHHKCNKNQP